jgi:hypothetical protein
MILVVGCGANGVSVTNANTPSQENFDITFLFEVDGVKIYRFRDAFTYRYFATGNGKFIPTRKYNNKYSYDYTDGAEQ